MKEESMHTFVLGTYAHRATAKTFSAVISGVLLAHFSPLLFLCRPNLGCFGGHPVNVTMGHLATHMKHVERKEKSSTGSEWTGKRKEKGREIHERISIQQNVNIYNVVMTETKNNNNIHQSNNTHERKETQLG